jgi:hypothetical protein
MKVFIEGGAKGNKAVRIGAQKAFRAFVKKLNLAKQPTIVTPGARQAAYEAFCIELKTKPALLWVDSEDQMKDIDKTWDHLKSRDKWVKPKGSTDEDVLLMETSMESWIAGDRDSFKQCCGDGLRANLLPSLAQLETLHRHEILKKLEDATAHCKHEKQYRKGAGSYEFLSKTDPHISAKHCKSLERAIRILEEKFS